MYESFDLRIMSATMDAKFEIKEPIECVCSRLVGDAADGEPVWQLNAKDASLTVLAKSSLFKQKPFDEPRSASKPTVVLSEFKVLDDPTPDDDYLVRVYGTAVVKYGEHQATCLLIECCNMGSIYRQILDNRLRQPGSMFGTHTILGMAGHLLSAVEHLRKAGREHAPLFTYHVFACGDPTQFVATRFKILPASLTIRPRKWLLDAFQPKDVKTDVVYQMGVFLDSLMSMCVEEDHHGKIQDWAMESLEKGVWHTPKVVTDFILALVRDSTSSPRPSLSACLDLLDKVSPTGLFVLKTEKPDDPELPFTVIEVKFPDSKDPWVQFEAIDKELSDSSSALWTSKFQGIGQLLRYLPPWRRGKNGPVWLRSTIPPESMPAAKCVMGLIDTRSVQ